MSHRQDYEAADMDYSRSSFHQSSKLKTSKRNQPFQGRRSGKAPQSINGIHRRRNRKMNW